MTLDKIVKALSASGRKAKQLGQYAVLGLTLAFSPGYTGCDEQTPCETSDDCGEGQECLEGVCGEGSCEESPFSGKYAWGIGTCEGGTNEPSPDACVVGKSYGTIFFTIREPGLGGKYEAYEVPGAENFSVSFLKPRSLSNFSRREECNFINGGFEDDQEGFEMMVEKHLCAVEHPQVFLAAFKYKGKEYVCPINNLFMAQDTPFLLDDYCSCVNVVKEIGIMDRCGISNGYSDFCE